MKFLHAALTVCFLLHTLVKVQAQDLDPRAYVRVPVRLTLIGAGFSYSEGGVVTDAASPVKDVSAILRATSLAVGYTFSMVGKTAQVSAALPYAWANATGTVGGAERSAARSGLCDMRLRWSLLFSGAPAATREELAKAPHRTVLGASITIVIPTGQYFPDKLINLGTNRWAFKPELALSQPLSSRWLFDLYAGMWLFTENNSYYTGSSVRTQDVMGSFQSHISYNISGRFWAAFDCTYYTGGQTSVNGMEKDDRQSNSRIGGTMVLPVGKRHSVKAAYSTGAIIRSGANFNTVSIGWQTIFIGKDKKAKE